MSLITLQNPSNYEARMRSVAKCLLQSQMSELPNATAGSLQEPLSMGRTLNERQIQRITRQLLLALEYMHGQRVVHGDIKPPNILLMSKTGIIKLCDFGMSLRLPATGGVRVSGFRGTYVYMAPEQFEGCLDCSVRTLLTTSPSSTRSHLYLFCV